jgi:type II secretory pathway pseudopilin PulG
VLNKSPGFTLIEVLIAAVIMIAVLTLTSMSFRSAQNNNLAAASTLRLLSPLPLITDTISAQIRERAEENLNGDGFLNGVQYSWTAKTELFSPPPPAYSAENDEYTHYPKRFRLYLVKLTLTNGKKTEQFEYKELAWVERSFDSAQ